MRTIALAFVLTVAGLASADVYHVQHRRASTLLGNLLGGSGPAVRIYEIKGGATPLVPEGVILKADDNASTITIEAPKSLVDDMGKLLGKFDVTPSKLSAHITIHSKADKYDSATDTQINNNSIFALKDQTTGLSLEISPRLNGDGTVTGSILITTASGSVRVVSRVAVDRKLLFGPSTMGPSGSTLQPLPADYKLLDVLDGLEIDITFSTPK